MPQDPGELKLPILRVTEASSNHKAHKYTLIGRGDHPGAFEQTLGVRFDRNDRQAAARVFETLRAAGLIASTMDDPIDPESWVELTDAGRTALQGGEIEKVDRPLVYIIHAATDGPIAAVLKSELERLLPGVRTFVASKAGDIPTGADWLNEIHTNLRAAETYIVLLTPRSIERLWVWYESGAAWQSERRRLPVLAGGLEASRIPYPLGAAQALRLDAPDEAAQLFTDFGAVLDDVLIFARRISEAAIRAGRLSEDVRTAVRDLTREHAFNESVFARAQNGDVGTKFSLDAIQRVLAAGTTNPLDEALHDALLQSRGAMEHANRSIEAMARAARGSNTWANSFHAARKDITDAGGAIVTLRELLKRRSQPLD